MGFALSKMSELLQNFFNTSREVKIVIVGLGNAGKTTSLYWLSLGEVLATEPTIGSNVETIKRGNIFFQAWDLGGQKTLRGTWSTYYMNAEAVILVIDSTDVDRLPLVKQELEKLLSNEDLEGSLLLVFANKQDINGALSAADLSNRLELHNIKSKPWHIQACTALTGQGLNEGLEWIAQNLKKA